MAAGLASRHSTALDVHSAAASVRRLMSDWAAIENSTLSSQDDSPCQPEGNVIGEQHQREKCTSGAKLHSTPMPHCKQ